MQLVLLSGYTCDESKVQKQGTVINMQLVNVRVGDISGANRRSNHLRLLHASWLFTQG